MRWIPHVPPRWAPIVLRLGEISVYVGLIGSICAAAVAMGLVVWLTVQASS